MRTHKAPGDRAGKTPAETATSAGGEENRLGNQEASTLPPPGAPRKRAEPETPPPELFWLAAEDNRLFAIEEAVHRAQLAICAEEGLCPALGLFIAFRRFPCLRAAWIEKERTLAAMDPARRRRWLKEGERRYEARLAETLQDSRGLVSAQ